MKTESQNERIYTFSSIKVHEKGSEMSESNPNIFAKKRSKNLPNRFETCNETKSEASSLNLSKLRRAGDQVSLKDVTQEAPLI
jgi:hypothetical protein